MEVHTKMANTTSITRKVSLMGCYFATIFLISGVDGAMKGIFGGLRGLLAKNTQSRGGSFRLFKVKEADNEDEVEEPMVYGPLLDTFRDDVCEIMSECRAELRLTLANVAEEIKKTRELEKERHRQEAEGKEREAEATLTEDERVVDDLLDSLWSGSSTDEGFRASFDIFTDLPDSGTDAIEDASIEAAESEVSTNIFAEVVPEQSDFVVGDTDEEEQNVVGRLFRKVVHSGGRKKSEKKKIDEAAKVSTMEERLATEDLAVPSTKEVVVEHLKSEDLAVATQDEAGPTDVSDTVEAEPAIDVAAQVSTPEPRKKKQTKDKKKAKRPHEKAKILIPELDIVLDYQADSDSVGFESLRDDSEDDESTNLVDTTANHRAILAAVRSVTKSAVIALFLFLVYSVGNLVASIVFRILVKPKNA